MGRNNRMRAIGAVIAAAGIVGTSLIAVPSAATAETTPAPAAEPVVVPNGGFEEFTAADSWVAAQWQMTTTVWVTTAAARSGSYSQALDQWNDATTLSQSLTAAEGTYDVSLFVWANESLGETRLVANGASVPVVSGGATQIDGTRTWDEIRVEDVVVGADGVLDIEIVVPELTSTTLTGFIDDVTVVPAGGGAEPEPVDSFLDEPGFEDGGAAWEIGGELVADGHAGSANAVAHSSAGQHETTQTVTGLADGNYRLTAWVRNDGGFDEAYLFAAGGGRSEARTALPRTNFAYDAAGTWKKTTLRGVQVTSGQLEVGLRTQGDAAGSVLIDDLALVDDETPYEMLVGGDISALTYTEDLGGRFADADGRETDPLQILADNGWNIVRIRVYNDPGKGRGDGEYYVPAGYVDADDALVLARRAADAGLQIQLSFHYSDYWTNPGLQTIPHAWQELIDGKSDVEAVTILETQVHDYTSDVLQRMNDQGTTPEYVSIGNETRSGMLFPYGGLANWDNLGRFYNAGAAAVREKAPDAGVIIHLDDGGNTSTYQTYFTNAAAQNVDYDIIGTSFYPFWTNKSAPRFAEFATTISQQFGKPIMVMETGFNYQPEKGAGGTGQLEHNGPYGPVSASTPELQRDFMIELFNELQGVPGGMVIGDLYWDPIQIYAGGQTGWAYFESTDRADFNAIDNTTLFDTEGIALPVLDAYRLNTRGSATGTVAGTVTDAAGQPAASVTVALTSSDGDERTATTNEYGDYYFAEVAPGEHAVHAERAGLGAGSVPAVTVTAGERADADVSISGEQALQAVSGTITGPDGAAVAGALVKATRDGFSSSRLADADGVYRFPALAEGAYTLTVTQDGYVAQTLPVTVSGSDVTASAQLVADIGDVAGEVVGPDGQPLAGASVSIGELATTTDAAGAFLLEGVPSGSGLVVEAELEGYLGSGSAPIAVVHSETTSGVSIRLPIAVPVVNGSFETAGAAGETAAEGWEFSSDPAGAAIRQDREAFGGTEDGRYAATFWLDSAYTARLAQTVTVDAPGTYTVRAHSYSGVTGALAMTVTDADGTVLARTPLPRTSSPQQVELTAEVTGTSFTIAFDVDGAAGDWAVIDKVEAGFLGSGQSEPEPDTVAPEAEITSPAEGASLRSTATAAVAATARDEGIVSSVSADLFGGKKNKRIAHLGDASSLESTEWAGQWALPDRLADGRYTIRLTATDAAGNETTATRSFQIDATRPSLSLSTTKATVTLRAKDAGGLQKAAANLYDAKNKTLIAAIGSADLSGTKAKQRWSLPTGLPQGTYTVRAAVRDAAGNTTTTTTKITVSHPRR